MRWTRFALGTTLLAIAGCGFLGSDDTQTGGGGAGDLVTGEDGPVSAPTTPPAGLPDLHPEFGIIGSTDTAPRKLTVRFDRPVVPDGTEALGADSKLAISPPVAGSWTWDGPSRLTFEPEIGFAPGVNHTVSITGLESTWGALAGPPVTHSFDVPPLKVLSAQRAVIGREAIDLDVVFSGPIDPLAERLVTFLVDGKPVRRTRVDADLSNRIRFRVARGDLPKGAVKIDVRIEEGAASLITPSAKAGSARFNLEIDTRVKPMEIRSAKLKEAADGWYLDIVCHDQAVGDPSYWWDRETYDSWEVSERCVLSPEAMSAVHFTPEVEGAYLVEGNHGFRVFGRFPRGELTVALDAGAFTQDGGVLDQAWTQTFTVAPRTPRADLLAKQGRYLPRGAWANLPIQHLNTDQVQVEVRQVPPQNLVFWLSDDDETATSRTADLVAEKKISVPHVADQVQSRWIDVGAMVGDDAQGLFEIRVTPVLPDEEPVSEDEPVDTGFAARQRRNRPTVQGDVSRIVLTDLQLIAKGDETPEGAPWPAKITVWSVGADDNEPVGGTDIDVVKPSGFVMASCRTGSDGSCELAMPAVGVDRTAPIALIARKGDDLTYLKFADLQVPVTETRVAGEPWVGGSPYKASVYGDRGVYRPGDTVHFGLILRDRDKRAPTTPVPAVLQVRDPRGKVAKQLALTPDASGMATADLGLPAFAPTGGWTALVEIGGKTVDSWGFAVEEFVPERMKVEATMQGEGSLAREAGTVAIEARYLFGGSAEGSPVDVNCSITPAPFTPKSNANYTYGLLPLGSDEPPREMQVSTQNVQLDAEGRATVPCGGAEEGYPVSGRLVADVAVFEAGSGRSTRAGASVPVHPERFYIGLDTGSSKLDQGETLRTKGIVVDWAGKGGKHTDTVDLVFYRLEEEYGWWWWDGRGEESYDLHLRRVEEERRTVSIGADGTFTADFIARAPGAGYLVRASSGAARTDLRVDGGRRRYSWSSGSSVDRTPRPAKPTSIDVTLPPQVQVGVAQRATIEVPFDGRMLVTLETHELLAHEWIEVKAGTTEWPFTLEEFVPNVYVSALLVKDPQLDSPQGYAPERAFGVNNVRVDPKDYRLDVKVGAPSEVRSNSPLTVTVDLGAAGKDASVTVAAVDEGILQLTKFQTPDPLADVFPQHRLGITTWETVGWSILMPAGVSARHGGDGGDASGRVQPVKPVALWSGKLTADATGKATVTLDVPQYRGQLRVMAVAASGERVGSGAAEVIVRDPLVLQTTLPRFLVSGDTFQVPVFVTNMSGKDRAVTVSLDSEYLAWPGMADAPNAPDPIELLGANKAVIQLANGASGTVAFQAKAKALVGAATFRVKVESDGLTSYEELEVPFAPAAPKSRTLAQVQLSSGALDLGPQLAGWLPTTEQTTLWVTPNPYGRAMGHLRSLIRYPHGCIEQTTSSTRPLLFVANLVPAMVPEIQGGELDKMVMHGVDRVLSMQTPSGGFGYWPGDRSPTPWASAYATHMLLDAKKLQYEVPQKRIDDAVDYLEDVVRQSEGETASFQRYAYSEPYTHYVLALAGRGKKARVQTLIDRMPKDAKGEEAEALYLLQAALFLSGDRRYEAALKAPDASPLTGTRTNSWSFYSDLRRRGFMLSVYHDLFGSDATGAEDLAQLVARGLETQESSWYTTQELMWGITGLGKRVAGGSQDYKDIVLKVDGKKVEPLPAGKGVKRHEPMWALPRASERKVELDVGNAGSGKLFLIVASEGVRINATYATGGRGLTLSRRYLDPDGNAIDVGNVQLGDVVYTALSVTNTTGETIQNLALVDRFAAGWEIENPRLGRSGVVDWVDTSTQWSADYMNLRDDRLELFGTLQAGETREVVYGLRAVTAGEFSAPPVEIEAMYDPGSLWARQPGTRVVVKGPWDGVLQ